MSGKIAIVTGGSKGIGAKIVNDLAKAGATVAFTYHHGEKAAQELKETLIHEGCIVEAFKVDITDSSNVSDFVSNVIKIYGQIDILVNNAGIIKDSSLLMMSSDDWKTVIDTNLSGVFNITKSCIFHMMKKKTGRIVNISSIGGITGAAGQTNYSASKAGIIGFSRSLAKEVAPYGIAVNVVAPSGVVTDMLENIPDKAKAAILSSIPLGRFCTVSEVSNVVCYLASDSPMFLTGSIIVLDGGSGIG